MSLAKQYVMAFVILLLQCTYGAIAEKQDCMVCCFFPNRLLLTMLISGETKSGVAWLCARCRASLTLQSHSLCSQWDNVSGDDKDLLCFLS